MRFPAAAVALGLLVLAGCAAGGPPEPAGRDDGVDAATGSIRGTVTDDQLVPLAGAAVSLDGTQAVVTGEDGGFAFSFVPPGDHAVAASLEGFANASRAVSVVAAEPTYVVLGLTRLGSETPYHETQLQQGLLGCSATVEGTFLYYANCEALYIAGLHSVDRHILGFQVGPLADIVGFWSETVWQPSQTFARALWILWTTSTGSQPDQNLYILYPFYDSNGPSPHRQRMEIANLTAHLEDQPSELCQADGDSCEIFSVNYSGHDTLTVLPAGIGVQVQQRYEQYLTTFHGGELPMDFTVLPDQ